LRLLGAHCEICSFMSKIRMHLTRGTREKGVVTDLGDFLADSPIHYAVNLSTPVIRDR